MDNPRDLRFSDDDWLSTVASASTRSGTAPGLAPYARWWIAQLFRQGDRRAEPLLAALQAGVYPIVRDGDARRRLWSVGWVRGDAAAILTTLHVRIGYHSSLADAYEAIFRGYRTLRESEKLFVLQGGV